MNIIMQNLSVLAYANNFTLWHYLDEGKSLTKPHFFDQAAEVMTPGDLIIATMGLKCRPKTAFYIVGSVEEGTVEIVPFERNETT